jgi:hypothetical protein
LKRGSSELSGQFGSGRFSCLKGPGTAIFRCGDNIQSLKLAVNLDNS